MLGSSLYAQDYQLSEDGKTLVKWLNKTTTDIDMQADDSLKEVTIIEYNAFLDCSNLVSINIGNKVKSIRGAFEGCAKLKSVTLPNGITDISDAFMGCTGLTSITIPNSVTNISGAFLRCTGLTSITIPDSVTDISRAFSGCTGLTSITIPNGVTNISGAFSGCTGLTSIKIPNNVKNIGEHTFSFCRLTTITIPKSVTEIDSFAFYMSSHLSSVIMEGSTPPEIFNEVGNIIFDFTAPIFIIYVPASSVNAYKTAKWWSKYAKKIKAQPTHKKK